MKLLHIDRNLRDRENLKTQLHKLGGQVDYLEANSSEQAIEALQNDSFDCIICDYEEDSLDGLLLLQDLRSRDIDTPFVLFTSNGNERIAAKAVAEGADDYIIKDDGLGDVDGLLKRINNLAEAYKRIRDRGKLTLSLERRGLMISPSSWEAALSVYITELSEQLFQASTISEASKIVLSYSSRLTQSRESHICLVEELGARFESNTYSLVSGEFHDSENRTNMPLDLEKFYGNRHSLIIDANDISAGRKKGNRKALLAPILVGMQFEGILVLISDKTYFEDYDLAIADRMAMIFAYALQRIRSEMMLKKSRDELQLKTDELIKTNQELDRFAYTVSHDLRNPIHTISEFCGILLSDFSDQLEETGQRFLRKILKSSQRMNEITDDLLWLSQATKMTLNKSPFSLTMTCKEIVNQFKELEPEREVNINIEDGLLANGDERLIKVAMENLISNAWKYTRKKDQAHISIGTEFRDKKRYFYIADNGTGFDTSHVKDGFKPFIRFHDSDKFEGTGIGMVTVERIISRHGGELKVKSQIGTGTVFYFTLG